MQPELILYGILPPLLFAAAIRTSVIDVRARRDSILLLSVGLVAFTVVAVGFAAFALIPAITLAAAFALRRRGRADRRDRGHGDRRSARAPASRRDDPRGREPAERRHGARGAERIDRRDRQRRHAGRDRPGLRDRGRSSERAWASPSGWRRLVGALAPALGRARHEPDPRHPVRGLPARRSCCTARACSPSSSPGCTSASGRRRSRRRRRRVAERLNWRTIQFLLENAVFLFIGLNLKGILAGALSTGPGVWQTVVICIGILARPRGLALRLGDGHDPAVPQGTAAAA